MRSDKVFICGNGHTIFSNQSPTVGVFFLSEDNQVILSVRGIEPHKGMLDTFGGFLDLDETLEQAVVRELIEETGLTEADYETPQYLTSAMGNYPYEGELLPVITSFYWTRLQSGKQIVAQDDSEAAITIPLHEIDMTKLHDEDIRQGVLALQKLLK